MQINWMQVIKDSLNPNLYNVTGKTKVKTNVCTFSGTLRIKTILLYKEGEYDLPYKRKIVPDENGIIFFEYKLFENQEEKYTGEFYGISSSHFYIIDDIVYYDEMILDSDGSNNKFVGVWKSYNNDNELICNWGDYRIPQVVGFDCGSESFYPCKEYHKYGWENFIKSRMSNSESIKAKAIENAKWWE